MAAVRRVARRGVDRGPEVSWVSAWNADRCTNRLELLSILQAHDHALAIGRKARGEAHVREIADDLALAGFDVEQIDPRLVIDERHVGDFLGRRREPRRQHQIAARVRTRTLAPSWSMMASRLTRLSLGSDLVDEDHAACRSSPCCRSSARRSRRRSDADAPPDVLGGRGELLGAVKLLGWVLTSHRRNSARTLPAVGMNT